MVFAMAPERAGCNAKLSFEETYEFRKCMFGADAEQSDFSVRSFATGTELITSIDKLGRFCSDLRLFTDIALCHSIRDVNAGFAEPAGVDLCFEFGNDLPTFEDRLAFVQSARESCRRYGVVVGKCHSMFAAITALTVAVVGARPTTGHKPRSQKGSVILSSLLGGFKEIYFREQGHQRSAHSDAISCLRFDYTSQVAYLRKRATDIADASGFGLSGALSSIALRNGLDLSIFLDPSMFFDGTHEEISCLQSDQPSNVTLRNRDSVFLMNQREVSGPLIVLVDDSQSTNDVVAYFEEHGLKPSLLGSYRLGTGKVDVI